MWSDLNKFAYKDKHVPEKTPPFLVYEIDGAVGKEKIVHLKHGIAKENYGDLLLGYQQVRAYCDKTNQYSKYELIIPEGYSGC